jgi:hypothetical protein
MVDAVKLQIDNGASATEMAEAIFGGSIEIIDATYIGDRNSSGIWSNGDADASDLTPSDTGVILSTGRVRDVTNSTGEANQNTNTSTNTQGVNGDSQFDQLAGTNTYDASILEVTFIPDTAYISMQFTFASEEYPEYVGSIFNDAVGIWINGVEVSGPVFDVAQINSVNQDANETLFVDNTGDAANTEMDGYTVTLSVLIPVNIGEENNIRIGIADVGDSSFDSAILIAGNSIQGDFIAYDDATTVSSGQTAEIDVTANDGQPGAIITITHVNGQEIGVGGSVTLNSGHVVTLLGNGNLSVAPPVGQAPVTEEESLNFTYTAELANGIFDTAFVTVTTIPCFTAGTRIRTPDGQRRVEDLQIGDLVETCDAGPQPIRWIGRRKVKAEGSYAPIVIEAGTFGHHRRLRLSPQHRVLVRHHMAEIMFGEDEVLIAAKDLVNECSIWIDSGGEVEYIHLLFDRHQMIWSEGMLTESFLPGPQVLMGFDEDVRTELLSLFPELDSVSWEGYGPSARPALRRYEALALFG